MYIDKYFGVMSLIILEFVIFCPACLMIRSLQGFCDGESRLLMSISGEYYKILYFSHDVLSNKKIKPQT
jgi:hypothetical protein